MECWVTNSTGSSFNINFSSGLLSIIHLARQCIKAINIFTVMISLFNFIEIMFTTEILATYLGKSFFAFAFGTYKIYNKECTKGSHNFLVETC